MPQTQLQLREAKTASVRQFPQSLYGGVPRTLLFHLATAADEAPDWWTPTRDAYLLGFWKTEPFLASAIYSLCARNAGFRWEVTGPPDATEQLKQVLQTAEFGQGWQELVLKVSEDLYRSDNGAFIEIIRPARAQVEGKVYPAIANRNQLTRDLEWHAVLNAFGGRKQVAPEDVTESPADWPVALAHLDSLRCTRTGDPDVPVIYKDTYGSQHELNAWQVITLSDMPSSVEEMHSVGFCMVSRVLRHAQTIRDFAIFRSEKISGRFARAVHLTNIDASLISDAIKQAEAQSDERGLTRYSQPIITNTIDPNGRPYNVTIPLAELPENWSEDDAMRWYIALIALAAGEHYSFFAPMPGRRLGSAREVEVQERQARGKSSRLFMEAIISKFTNSGVLPPNVTFTFKERDPEEQAANEESQLRRAQTRRERIESGEITPQVARQIAADEGDLTDQYLSMMGERDVTPDETVSDQTEGATEREPETVVHSPGEPPAEATPAQVEEKQEGEPPEPWGEKPVVITVEDIARAIAKWNERLPEGAEDLLLATEQEPDEDEERATKEAVNTQDDECPFVSCARYKDDKHDLPYSAAAVAKTAKVPERVDNRALFAHVPVWNQGKEPACVGMAAAAGLSVLFGKLLSPRDAFERAKKHDEWPGEDYPGSSVRAVCKAASHEGCCEYPLRPWRPFDTTTKPAGADEDASKHRIARYERLWTKAEMQHVIAAKEHGFCLVTIDVQPGWLKLENGYRISYDPSNQKKGTHAVLIDGYDDVAGYWLLRNCWGRLWGDKGHGWLRYDDAEANMHDAWLLLR